MTKIKFGSIVVSGSGKLGGHLFQGSPSGAILRTKPNNKQKPSFAQSLIRSYNSIIHGGWRNLSDQQRLIWIKAAPHPLSGSQFWYQCQYTRLAEGLPFLQNPANKLETYLGAELIDQATWADVGLPFWSSVSAGWAGDGSVMSWTLDSGFISVNSFWTIGKFYKVVITVHPSGFRLKCPYDGLSVPPNASTPNTYSYITHISNSTNCYMYASTSFGFISALSIKEVFNYCG